MVRLMARALLAMVLLSLAASGAEDWLEGGHVRGGDYGDISQHFTDPIFSSPGVGYLSSDPAVREMQQSLDRPLALGSAVERQPSDAHRVIQPVSAAGGWHLDLSDGKQVDLILYQSGTRLFGAGEVRAGLRSQRASASGTVSGSSMMLDLVTFSGTELYSISLDLGRLHLPSTFEIYRAGSSPVRGTAKALRTP